MTAEWLFRFISVIYHQIMDLLGVKKRNPVEQNDKGMNCANKAILQGQMFDRICRRYTDI